MAYSYFDHVADVGIRGIGGTLEEAFSEGAQAMLDLICEHQFRARFDVNVRLKASSDVDLWLALLNELLFLMDARDLFISSCRVYEIRNEKDGLSLLATAMAFSKSQEVVTMNEVKAATHCEADVKRDEAGLYSVQCVVDI